MPTKTQMQDALVNAAQQLILKAGGVTASGFIGDFTLETRGGFMRIHVSPDYPQRGQPVKFTLFCRFLEPEKAKAAGILDRHNTSSKWNHHALLSVGDVRMILERCMPTAPAEGYYRITKPFTCQGCGREEGVCSVDPCDDVTADREATMPVKAQVGVDIEDEREYDAYFTRCEAANFTPMSFGDWHAARAKEVGL